MSGNQTVETDASVDAFIDSVEHETRRQDAHDLVRLMRRVTGVAPKMWGPSIVGFGSYHYRYDSGREGDMLRVGFSPRKSNIALYFTAKGDAFAERVTQLGKHTVGASCMYVNKLDDIDTTVLEELVRASWTEAGRTFGPNGA